MPEETKRDEEVRTMLDTDRPFVVSHHKLGEMSYTATVGMLPLKDARGEEEAAIFFTAYTKDGVENPSERPLMFSFNGGPGSSSVWLHLGTVGPKRVVMEPDGQLPAPPYRLEDNPESWLEHADLVFIDPVGTGYSRAAKKDGAKKFWGLEGDLDSVAEFIRLFLARFKRWASPLYMVGESYGTTRAAGLSGKLIDRGIAFKGILLVSSILNFQTARFNKGNDLPYVLFLPTYTATAWFHGRLPHFSSLEEALEESEAYAAGPYHLALAQGDLISEEAKAEAVAKISRLTGLSESYVDQSNIRINIHRFCKELRRDERRTVGRLDSRFVGIDEWVVTENPEHDPSMSALMPPYTAMINDWLGRGLGWETDFPYRVFAEGELWKCWEYGNASEGHPDTSEALRMALSKNPHMKIFVASGYYDLATPYFATEYTLSHLNLDPSLRSNLRTEYYKAGHMMYIDEPSLAKLNGDIASFLKS